MSTDGIEPQAAESTSPVTGSNGAPHESSDASHREVVILRARCSNLRHWCRALLEDRATAGVLDERTLTDLRGTSPKVTEPEGQAVLALLARGGNVTPNHPLAPQADDTGSLRAVVTSLVAEHEQLRSAFFALYDHLHPDDHLTDEYFLAQQGAGPMRSMADVLAELEGEFGERP